MDPLNLELSPLRLKPAHWDTMLAAVTALAPEEACGLLSGNDRHVHAVHPLDNILHSPVRFRIDPQAQIDLLLSFENRGLELVGIYHSHPEGPPHPSAIDLAEAYYPEALNLIWSRNKHGWTCRAYLIRDGQSQEVQILRV